PEPPEPPSASEITLVDDGVCVIVRAKLDCAAPPTPLAPPVDEPPLPPVAYWPRVSAPLVVPDTPIKMPTLPPLPPPAPFNPAPPLPPVAERFAVASP